MRSKPAKFAESCRVTDGPLATDATARNNGAFLVLALSNVPGELMQLIASDGLGWDHVSVSLPTRCPTWEEMCYVKSLFWLGTEWVLQFHPPVSDNINNHRYCLHLWKQQGAEVAAPPRYMV